MSGPDEPIDLVQGNERIRTITSWEELYCLPNFAREVSVEAVKIGSIYCPYEIASKERKPCAITACRHKHFNGRVIKLVDGRLTNIGQVCGKKYFPADDWERENRAYKVRLKAQDRVTQIENMEELRKRVLVDMGNLSDRLKWSDQAMQTLAKNVSPRVVDQLFKRAERRESEITRERNMTAVEIEVDRDVGRRTAAGERSRVVVESLGRFRGLSVFSAGGNPLSLKNRILKTLDRIAILHTLDERGVKAVLKESEDIGALMSRLRDALSAAEDFFTDENLAQLRLLQWARETRLRSIRISSDGTVLVSESP